MVCLETARDHRTANGGGIVRLRSSQPRRRGSRAWPGGQAASDLASPSAPQPMVWCGGDWGPRPGSVRCLGGTWSGRWHALCMAEGAGWWWVGISALGSGGFCLPGVLVLGLYPGARPRWPGFAASTPGSSTPQPQPPPGVGVAVCAP
ncbi:hypothetical protein GGTG_05236 [Gaeumannomyces tritici R3-111a-1]|uniref:Uncharacterized protein n=1 Tax=Gaeumannomyces tritici (strain R3-111a-1) TaxID=644352 RepID=J3NVC3_GAET3|nr:hypothetical protein GGTG_05236 [Gaeumannomyces tritici R3-111a-1]EJT75299.1 hypothetical protein GGTG_05236 [Gaeumannomyces tritici R3-111a-1]